MAINDQENGADLFDSPPKSSPYSEEIEMAPHDVLINDLVHRPIRLHPVCLAVVDTLEFQRLRSLKQCGICYLVYPTANHSRFEHSLGVSHLAQEFMRHCGVEISEEKKLCVTLAGLCHDLGHGPFSHLWEHFLERSNKKWKHEGNSVRMFRTLVENNNLRPTFRKYGLNEEHEELICNLILGQPPADETDVFLYEIIANDRNGIDVDKFEYILRDGKQFGVKFHIEIDRIINNLGVVEKDGKRYMGFRDKISKCLVDIFNQRANLHDTCYQHHACKAAELMLLDALSAADEHYRISWFEPVVTENGEQRREIMSCKLSECHLNTNAFLRADDTIFQNLLHSTSPELEDSRKILESMMKRDFYSLVLTKKFKSGSINDRRPEDFGKLLIDELSLRFGEKYGCRFVFCLKNISIEIPNVFLFRKDGKISEMTMDDMKLSSLIGENRYHKELLVFCTKGKKTLNIEATNTQLVNLKDLAGGICDALLRKETC